MLCKYRMAELPNGKYLVLELNWFFGWQYPRYWSNTNGAMMAMLANLSYKSHDDVGCNTMKEAIDLFCKVKALIRLEKAAEKASPKIKITHKWYTEAAMLTDKDFIN